MTGSRRLLAVLVLAIAAAAATAALALGGGKAGPPRPALVTSHGLRAASVVGSYCSSSGNDEGRGVGGCGDAEYPLHPKAVLPITARSRLRVNLRKRADKLQADFVRVNGSKFDVVGPQLAARPVPGTHRRVWRVKLPGHLHGADAVAMFANFADGGDADMWVGVKPVDQWP